MPSPFSQVLRIGTRGSPLALAQTRLFISRIEEHFPDYRNPGAVEVIEIRASGDYDPAVGREEYLRDRGGKGLFTKELEEALLHKRIDVAIHSMKDVPTWLPPGLVLAGVLPRAEMRDALISPVAKTLSDLPKGARIGTSSVRRQAQLLHARPDLAVMPFRGNVDTRLKKLQAGTVDGIILAACGLQRLGLGDRITGLIDTHAMLPSPAQGIVGFEIEASNAALAEMLEKISCKETFTLLAAERAMLEVLDGSCATPIGGLGEYRNGDLHLRGLVAHPEGKGLWRADAYAAGADAKKLGQDVGRALRQQVPAGILPEG